MHTRSANVYSAFYEVSTGTIYFRCEVLIELKSKLWTALYRTPDETTNLTAIRLG